MGRLAGVVAALALAAGCGKTVQPEPGPLGYYYKPTGIAVQRFGAGAADARLLVLSTNADIYYDVDTGGSLIALEGDLATTTYRRSGAINVRSFGGDLAVTDPETCGTVKALFATRGSNTLNVVAVAGDGQLRCEGCGLGLSGAFTDPLPVIAACNGSGGVAGSRTSAFIGYLQAVNLGGWVSEFALADGAFRSMAVGAGPVRALAYDRTGDRLFVVGLATATQTPLKVVDLAGCTFGASAFEGGCAARTVAQPAHFGGLELRSVALAAPVAGRPQRLYLTGRVYDAYAAALAGGRTTDYGGRLIVADLLEGSTGPALDVVEEVEIGHGAQDVRVLPRLPAWDATTPPRGDILAALTVDEGYLWLYDTETGALGAFGKDPRTGTPLLGGSPYGLAVDPQPVSGNARVYVGSYSGSYVIPIDVPLAAPDPVNASTFAGGPGHRLTGGAP